jgi:hypothetical protein
MALQGLSFEGGGGGVKACKFEIKTKIANKKVVNFKFIIRMFQPRDVQQVDKLPNLEN